MQDKGSLSHASHPARRSRKALCAAFFFAYAQSAQRHTPFEYANEVFAALLCGSAAATSVAQHRYGTGGLLLQPAYRRRHMLSADMSEQHGGAQQRRKRPAGRRRAKIVKRPSTGAASAPDHISPPERGCPA